MSEMSDTVERNPATRFDSGDGLVFIQADEQVLKSWRMPGGGNTFLGVRNSGVSFRRRCCQRL